MQNDPKWNDYLTALQETINREYPGQIAWMEFEVVSGDPAVVVSRKIKEKYIQFLLYID